MAVGIIRTQTEAPLKHQESQPDVSLQEEQIRRRAHEIWLENGSPAGTDLIDWLEAEQEILNERVR